jgi:hypothetical protein
VARACKCVPWALGGLLMAGCLGQPGAGGNERYVPSEETARYAVEAALSAWKEGRPPGPVAEGPPAVYLIDSHRRPGQTLADYEILGPTPGEGPVLLAVRLTLANPAAEERARFVVFGIDPLWVYRQEDFEMMIHMDHPMDDGKSSRKATSP